jgi:hypothetical protein
MTDQAVADRKALEKLAQRPDSGDQWEAIETDEPTPQDPAALHRLVVRKLDAVLAAQAVTARVLLRHDDWLAKVGKVWEVANNKVVWAVGAVLAARPELLPQWARDLFWTLIGGGQ